MAAVSASVCSVFEGETLRVATNVAEGMTGLRLGSMRLDLETHESAIVNLREVMFGI